MKALRTAQSKMNEGFQLIKESCSVSIVVFRVGQLVTGF